MHGKEFAFQTGFAFAQAAIQFVPQLVLYGLLRLLEQRAGEVPIATTAWFLVAALGASTVLASWAE